MAGNRGGRITMSSQEQRQYNSVRSDEGTEAVRSQFLWLTQQPNFDVDDRGENPILLPDQLKRCISRTRLSTPKGAVKLEAGKWSADNRHHRHTLKLPMKNPYIDHWNRGVAIGKKASIIAAVADYWSQLDVEMLLSIIYTTTSSVKEKWGYWVERAPAIVNSSGHEEHELAVHQDGLEWAVKWDDGVWVNTGGTPVEVNKEWTMLSCPVIPRDNS